MATLMISSHSIRRFLRAAILTTSILGLAACSNDGDRPASPTSSAYQIPSATASAASTVAVAIPWRIYTNTRSGYEFQYPSDWMITGGREPQPGDDFEAQSVDV